MKSDPHPQLNPPPITYRMMQAVMSPVLMVLGLCCRSAYELCNEQMDRELKKSESIRLRIHLMMCGLCSHLPAQFAAMRELIQATCEHEHEGESCSESLSEEARTKISDHLKNQAKNG